MDRRKVILMVLFLHGLVLTPVSVLCSQAVQTIAHPETGETLELFPYTYTQVPDLPSPYTLDDGTVIVVGLTQDHQYILFPVTIENDDQKDYPQGKWYGKGQQLTVDASDFPTLAKTGLHSEIELSQITSITGRSVAEITEDGRPDRSSFAGFMGQDEDILSVLRGDNRLVARLGSTHPKMAEPLFHVLNLVLSVKTDSGRGNIGGIKYNKKKIHLKFKGEKGWQESIFNDEILGYWEIEIRREPDPEELAFLARKYVNLKENEMTRLITKLFRIHTGEMAAYYIMRYGFYEGHTDYRADPVALSLIFGLISLEEIETVFPGKIPEIMFNHFTSASQESLPALERILENYLSALGGRDALDRVPDKICSGQLVWSFPDQDPDRLSIPVKIFADEGGRWRLALQTLKGAQGMGYDGDNGWIQNADRILMDARQKRSKLAYLFSSRGPLEIEEFFPDLTLESKEILAGRTVYRVKTVARDMKDTHLYFDAETGLLVKIGEDLILSDYREQDGVMYPFRITVERGNNTAVYEFDSIAADLSLSPGQLSIPAQDEAFPDAFEGLVDPKVLPLLIDLPSGHEDMNVPCRDGRFLYDFIRQNNYRRGLEIGTFTGYSTLWFGLAFKETGGRLITIEIDKKPGEEARCNFRKAGLEDVIDSRIADAFEEIQKIEGRFDFIFIDAWKPDYMRFLELLRDRVAPGGAIIAHNVTNYARDMHEFLEAIKKDPGLATTLNETSAEGMSISRVRDPDSTTGAEIEASDFSPEELQADLMELREAMERLHPALYDHTTREEFDRLFDSGNRALSDSADLERAYQIYASLMAKIGCCHSSVWMPGGYWNNLPGRLFPIKLKFLGNRAFAIGSYSDTFALPKGSELLSINGKGMGEILRKLKTTVSADAYSEGYKNYRLGFRFPLIYSLYYGHPDSFSVTFTPSGGNGQEEKIVKPVPTNRIWGHMGSPGRLDLEIRKEKNAAVMTISHFVYYRNHDKFFGFVDDAFERIAQNGINHLVLDLRGNSGGDPFCSSYLFAYLAREPVPYFAEPYGKYTSLAEPIEIKANHFTGRLFILIDGGCASTTGHLCGLLKYHKLGTLIGEETGATYFCHDGHENLNLKHTRLQVSIATGTYAAAVQGLPKDRGIIPDIPVLHKPEDMTCGRDTVLEYALELCR